MSLNETVIVYAGRTPIGKMNGAYAATPAPRLTAALIRDVQARTGLEGAEIDEIMVGNVLTSGIGQAPARQAAIYGGLPESVCATTVGRVCGSGIKSVMLADQAIRLGDSRMILAGGQENMTMAPHLLPGSRSGYRFGGFQARDSMQWDGLWDPYSDMAMGSCGEICAREYGFTREEQDQFAIESYRRARKAVESGVFAGEIVPVEVTNRRSTKTIELDEEPFSVDLDRLTGLRPAFDKEGTVTAGNSSSISDGAALLLLTDRPSAEAAGLKPLATIRAQASFAHAPQMFTTAPVGCIRRLLDKAGMQAGDIDAWEINEAFAVVPMAAIRDLNLDHEKVNMFGGAVSLGHPIGASGARILVTLLNVMREKDLKTGLATLCIGGGEASGVIVERA